MKFVGAHLKANQQCEFIVWAPLLKSISLSIVSPQEKTIELTKDEEGYFSANVNEVMAGTQYFFNVNGQRLADPASFFQPQGIHGPSMVVDHKGYAWNDKAWKGIALKNMIIYELHIGAFSAEGNFEGAEKKLGDLLDLGINAIEIMPVAQFPGDRNWGYDGVFPFAVQNSYGGPEGLKRLIDACHQRGMAVILDVVYNHLGPEGNVLPQYMPVFTDKYRTPWGQAINFDGAYAQGVRNFFIQNALYWLEHYHIDALRLDAIHGIFDMSAKHFLKELASRVEDLSQRQKRKFYLIAESDLNDRRVILEASREGYGIDAQWSDDFHHAIHAVLTHEQAGYYEDFGGIEQVARVMKEAFVYAGNYSVHRKRCHGSSVRDIPSERFVVCLQNHDQIGNRFNADRLSALISFEGLKLAAGALILSPYVPMLFMGEEYGEEAPFNYFMSFQDSKLIEAVRKGRREEFSSFGWKKDPLDPWDEHTFHQSRLHWEKRYDGKHKTLLAFYKRLIELRKTIPALSHLNREGMDIEVHGMAMVIKRYWGENAIFLLMNFGSQMVEINSNFPMAEKILDSCEKQWGGKGTALASNIIPGEIVNLNSLSIVLYQHL